MTKITSNPDWPTFPTDIRADSVEKAVQLAKNWRTAGRFDLFRGQSAPWGLEPTQLRIPEDEYPAAKERMQRFFRWLSASAGLAEIASSMDAVLAVAQHYGLPTRLLDFTSDVDVAAFFATHAKHQAEGAIACIICLNSSEYVNAWNLLRPKTIEPLRILTPTVPDLWRLESQKGCFLEVRYHHVESVVAPQRILFPFRSPWLYPPEDQIYPIRKSRLEILLEHYFDVERTAANREWFAEIQRDGIGIGIEEVHLRPPLPFLEEYLDKRAVETLPRWEGAIVGHWLRQPDEKWNEVRLAAVTPLQFGAHLSHEELRRDLAMQFSTFIAKNPGVRGGFCSFRFPEHPELVSADRRVRLEAMAVRLWDGMRNLPFTDQQIAGALARMIVIELVIQRNSLWSGSGWTGVFAPAIPGMIKVGLGTFGGTGGSAFLPEPAFRSALRSDLKGLFHRAKSEKFENTNSLLQVVTSPEILFPLDLLVELFAEYLIPTQILMFDADQPVIFNPADLATFGAP